MVRLALPEAGVLNVLYASGGIVLRRSDTPDCERGGQSAPNLAPEYQFQY